MIELNPKALLFLLLFAPPAFSADLPTTIVDPVATEGIGHAVVYEKPWLIVGNPGPFAGEVRYYKEISPNNFQLMQSSTASPSFGHALAITKVGNHYILAVGEPDYGVGGRVRIYETQEGTNWILRGTKLSDPDDRLGYSLDITSKRLLVGMPGNNKARVYYADYSGSSIPVYQYQTDIYGTAYDGAAWGTSVAIGFSDASGAGRYIYAVGAPNADYGRGDISFFTENYATTPKPVLFARTLDESLRVNDHLGSSLDMDGELLITGAPDFDGALTNMGAAYVYKVFYAPSNPNAISRIHIWTAFDGNTNRQQAYARFGSSVAIREVKGSHNGIFTAISGAPGMDRSTTNQGAAFLFDNYYNVGNFLELHNPGAAGGSNEGAAVALTGPFHLSGNKAATGSPGEGLVQIYD